MHQLENSPFLDLQIKRLIVLGYFYLLLRLNLLMAENTMWDIEFGLNDVTVHRKVSVRLQKEKAC